MEPMINDKLSIKNLLFSKAIPNYVISVPISGHKVFSCTDCGDKFILESSYEYHINRKSVKISYFCRHCSLLKIFYNRCNLLAHIRSHAFKTATINVTDLKVEPLPINYFNKRLLKSKETSTANVTNSTENTRKQKLVKTICFECKKDVTSTGMIYRDRAKHYMKYSLEVYTCPVCMFALPSHCGLRAHLRLHLKCHPYYCPECGIHLPNKSAFYPYNHDCEGFKMMRATSRLKCPVPECPLYHPNEIKEHMKNEHFKKVYKCSFCFIAAFDESIMKRHLKGHKPGAKALIFFQCQICTGRLVSRSQIDNHLKLHINNNMYPCWACGTIFKSVSTLIEHHVNKHGLPSNILLSEVESGKSKRIYRVVKRCDQCKRSFTYKCKFEQIEMLPIECPYKCSSESTNTDNSTQITCHICKQKISDNWEKIKKHYEEYHKTHRCIDIKVILTKLDIRTYLKKQGEGSVKRTLTTISKRNEHKHRKGKKRKVIVNCNNKIVIDINNIVSEKPRNGVFQCNKCNHQSESKELLEIHMLDHRDPYMAYQCMECGQSFAVKPSFATHLVLEHGISDVQDYISKKQCYNEDAFVRFESTSIVSEPLRENQCRICRDQFNNSEDLTKHFRVHGMAFLLKNNADKNSSP